MHIPTARDGAVSVDRLSDLGAPDPMAAAVRAGAIVDIVMDPAAADALMLACRAYVGAVWDEAVALAGQEPAESLAAAEPWSEADEAYSRRMGEDITALRRNVRDVAGWLDIVGRHRGLLRARLVRAEG